MRVDGVVGEEMHVWERGRSEERKDGGGYAPNLTAWNRNVKQSIRESI